MMYSFRANLLMRVWTGLLLLMVAMLIGVIVTNATGTTGDALIAIMFMAVIFIISIMVLIGACRLVIAWFRAVLWR
jgi:cation transporter-like permease